MLTQIVYFTGVEPYPTMLRSDPWQCWGGGKCAVENKIGVSATYKVSALFLYYLLGPNPASITWVVQLALKISTVFNWMTVT